MTNEVSPSVRDTVLKRASDRNIPVEFAVGGDSAPTVKSRFLGATSTDTDRSLILAAPSARQVRAPLTPGTSLKVTLTLDGQRYVFTSTVLRRSRVTLKSGASANAISVRYPQTLAALQRRTHYRARVPDGVCLEVRCTAKAGVRLVKFKALAADISIGGIGLAVPPEGVAFAKRGTLWALAFELPDSSEPLKYLAEVRHIRKESGRPLAAGMQFRIGEEDLEARQGLNALAQYVARLERQELKRLSRDK